MWIFFFLFLWLIFHGQGTRHAELEAIQTMQDNGFTPQRFANIDLYVTIEPCVMCAAALLLMGVH